MLTRALSEAHVTGGESNLGYSSDDSSGSWERAR